MNRSMLEQSLMRNVLMIEFRRRTDPIGKIRRSLCTKSNFVLTSFQGRSILNYRPPNGPPRINLEKHNLVIVWDIFVQDYRMIPCDGIMRIVTIPDFRFWEYFNEVLVPMPKSEKVKFMNT